MYVQCNMSSSSRSASVTGGQYHADQSQVTAVLAWQVVSRFPNFFPGNVRDPWKRQRPLETSQAPGNVRDPWKRHRPLETSQTPGNVTDPCKRQRPGETLRCFRKSGNFWNLFDDIIWLYIYLVNIQYWENVTHLWYRLGFWCSDRPWISRQLGLRP